MLDGKVLTAVLASLAAIGAAINGGGIDAERVQSNSISAPGEFSFNDIVPDSLSSLDRFLRNPEPENPVSMVFVSDDLNDESLRVKSARLSAANFTSLEFAGRTARSDERIQLFGFTGEVMPAEITEIHGAAGGFESSGVNVTGHINLRRELDTGFIRVEDVKRSAVQLKDVTGSIDTNSSSADISEARGVSINSFSGSILVYPANSTIVMDGKVDRLESGSFSFGG